MPDSVSVLLPVIVVNAPVDGVVAPMAVELMPRSVRVNRSLASNLIFSVATPDVPELYNFTAALFDVFWI